MSENKLQPEGNDNEKVGAVTYKFTIKEIKKFLGAKGQEIEKAINVKLDNFISGANKALAESDKKFTGMYNMLIKKFLVELENRVYTSELSNKTMLLIFAEKFHKIESDLNKLNAELGTSLSLNDYLKDMEVKYATKMKEVHETSEAAMVAEQQAEQTEVANAEPKETIQEETSSNDSSPTAE